MQDDFDRKIYYGSDKTDRTAAAIALLAALLIHVGGYYAIPAEFSRIAQKEKNFDELKIEILPPKIEKKTPTFIEANPYANDTPPESPDSPESFKNQRAADELPDPSSKSKMPYVEGEIKNGKKIVSGTSGETDTFSPEAVLETLNRPLEHPAQASESSPQPSAQPKSESASTSKNGGGESASAAKSDGGGDDSKPETPPAKTEQNSLSAPETSGFVKFEKHSKTPASEKPDGEKERKGVKSEKSPEKPNKGETLGEKGSGGGKPGDAPKQKENSETPEQPKQQESQERQNQPDLPAPRPRPTLSMKIPAGPLADNRSHASSRGVVACDSRFSEFGAYQQRMIEAIARQWNLLASKYDLGTAVGSIVAVEFYLNTSGELSKFKILFSTSTNTGTGLCEQSILTTAPYGEWTQEMVNAFGGQDQSVKITFHYR